jgi:hypothetical protein
MAFMFRLEHEDGTPAEPRAFEAAVPNWSPGDTIPLGRGPCAWLTFERTTRINPRRWWSSKRPDRNDH